MGLFFFGIGFGTVVVALVVIVLFKNLMRSYLLPRDRSLPEKYPFETTWRAIRDQNRVLESLYDAFFIENKELMGDRFTAIFNILFMPAMVITLDVANITYILKTNYENFGKTGSLKTKFQPILGDGIFNSDGQQWYGHRKTSAHLFKLEKFRTSIIETFNNEMFSFLSLIRANKGEPFDIQNLMARLTLESIGHIALGVELGCLKDRESVVPFAKMFDYCTAEIDNSLTNPLWRVRRYFSTNGWRFFWYVYRLDQFCYKIIRDRRAQMLAKEEVLADSGASKQNSNNDLLSLYLDKASFSTMGRSGSDVGDESPAAAGGRDAYLEPTDRNLRDVVLNIAIAGN